MEKLITILSDGVGAITDIVFSPFEKDKVALVNFYKIIEIDLSQIRDASLHFSEINTIHGVNILASDSYSYKSICFTENDMPLVISYSNVFCSVFIEYRL